MSITVLRRIMASALLLCTALPSFAQDTPPPIAVQMWTLRGLPTLEDQLKAVQAAGVSAVEIVNTHGLSADELKRLLDQYSIQVTSMHLHTPISELIDNLDALVETNRTLGNDKIVSPWLPPEQRPTDAAGWIAIGEMLGEAARKVEAAGLTFAWHNHDFEMVEFDGKTGLDLLFEAAGPALKAEFDVAWMAVAGRDPVEFLNKYSGRVFAIHAKDKAGEGHPEEEQGLADVGAGVLDWDAILSAAHAAGVQWYIIEHDFPRDPAASIKNSAQFLTEHLSTVGITNH